MLEMVKDLEAQCKKGKIDCGITVCAWYRICALVASVLAWRVNEN